MHIRLGPLILTTRGWVEGLATHIGEDLGRRRNAEMERADAVIARQHDLMVAAEAERNLAVARYREANEALGERLDELERYRSILQHPVSQPPSEEQA